MTFAEKALCVFKAKNFTDADIEEAKQMVREAWPNENMKVCWINWINAEYAKGFK